MRPHVAWLPCKNTSNGNGAPARFTGRYTRAHNSVINLRSGGASANTTGSKDAGSLYSELVTASGPTPAASGASAAQSAREITHSNPAAAVESPNRMKEFCCMVLSPKGKAAVVYTCSELR